MEHYNMNLTLKVWKQNSREKRRIPELMLKDISSEMSFLEIFDVLNEQLIRKSSPSPLTWLQGRYLRHVQYVYQRRAHGPMEKQYSFASCMRAFKDGDTISL